MRISLELGVLEECMKTLSDSSKREIFVTKMQAMLVSQHASLLDNDTSSFLRLDDALHHLLYTQANCEWVWETLTAHTGNDHRIRILSYSANEIPKLVESEHAQIIEAIKKNDAKSLFKLEKEHLSRLYGQITELERSFPDFFE